MAPRSQSYISIKVRVQPRASKDEVLGYQGDALHLRVTAPPEAGKANEAVVSLLAEVLDVAKSQIRIVRGHTSRDKLISVVSLTLEEVQQRLRVYYSGTGLH
jgi:uncharacterized protein (TIGR00251 family)